MKKLRELISSYASDVFFYYGGINRNGYADLCAQVERRIDRKSRACLVLVTFGGDPNAGFRIARCLRHHYEKLGRAQGWE